MEEDSTTWLWFSKSCTSQEALAMSMQGCLENVIEYKSPKYIRVEAVTWARVKGCLYLVAAVLLGSFIAVNRLYQEEVDEISSSVRTNVKGVAYTKDRIWDIAEYTIPMQATNSFFVMTNIIMTENQRKQRCPEYPFAKAICSSDEGCKNGTIDTHSNGIQTGRCVDYNVTFKTCEVEAWCPVQPNENPPEPAVLRSSEDFTVLIKNNINFPKFNSTKLNIPENFNNSCTYNKTTCPLCPIFRLGDIVQEANQKFSEMAIKGGIIAIRINWDCNLDSWSYSCSPKYSFQRLDDNKTMPGFHFRYARYYKTPHGEEQRTLFEVYGIRFDVLVFGTGRKFDIIKLIKNIGSVISYVGLVAVATEIVIFVMSHPRWGKSEFYKTYIRKKYETVLNPTEVMYVSHVDEPHIILIKTPLKTSLQHAEGSIVESHPVKFFDADSFCTSESNEKQDNEGSEPPSATESAENDDKEKYELKQPLTGEASSSDCQKWCCCGKCQPTQKYHKQLCCRRKKGQCITTSPWFQQLVLSRHTLKKALLYKDPFVDLTGGNINNQLRHLAYKQYVRWRFGFFELEDRAIIPSCCRWSHPVKFFDADSFCTSESNEKQDNEGSEPPSATESAENDDKEKYELKQPLTGEASSSDCQKWCCCGKCQPTQKYHKQLCCRRKKGQCITTSPWFQQLVLSRHTLKKALLYKDPFVDLTGGNINNQLRHLAYKQYVRWRFGFFELEDRAIIPSCCRWKIKHTYPK
ncbi:PREDICTED: P2X purinoceptor 7 [Calidris pugnax]|uniref:P2X purinoceptor 7 n=1 Tax=Calidris pugnax TaxID=198806 RepID=UPI00071DB530|nr:PREDICTED: P2X purinoceptor 7 [Calidris pugnax]